MPCKARGSYAQPADTPGLRELLWFFSIAAGGQSGLQTLPFAVPLAAPQQTCPPAITSAPSPPESLLILAPSARADALEQPRLRAEFFQNLRDCFDMPECVSQRSPTTQAAPRSPSNTRPGGSS